MQRVGWVQGLLKPRKYVARTFLYLVANECMFNESLCGYLVTDLLLCELVVGFWQRSLAHSHSTSHFLEMGQLLRYCASPSNILFFMMLVPAPSDCFSELRDIKISWLPQGSGSLPWGAPPQFRHQYQPAGALSSSICISAPCDPHSKLPGFNHSNLFLWSPRSGSYCLKLQPPWCLRASCLLFWFFGD